MKSFLPRRIIFQLVLALLSFIIIGCDGNSSNNNKSENEDESEYYSEEGGYEDGTYCAEIDYYYSETGTSSTYTLEVEIENNELTVIHWPNGGWLDDSHFSPPDISDSEASFTSDRGVDYSVRIIGKEGDCALDTYVTDEDELIRKKEEREEEEYRNRQEEEERIRQEEDEEEKQEEEDGERKRQEDEDENENDNE